MRTISTCVVLQLTIEWYINYMAAFLNMKPVYLSCPNYERITLTHRHIYIFVCVYIYKFITLCFKLIFLRIRKKLFSFLYAFYATYLYLTQIFLRYTELTQGKYLTFFLYIKLNINPRSIQYDGRRNLQCYFILLLSTLIVSFRKTVVETILMVFRNSKYSF